MQQSFCFIYTEGKAAAADSLILPCKISSENGDIFIKPCYNRLRKAFVLRTAAPEALCWGCTQSFAHGLCTRSHAGFWRTKLCTGLHMGHCTEIAARERLAQVSPPSLETECVRTACPDTEAASCHEDARQIHGGISGWMRCGETQRSRRRLRIPMTPVGCIRETLPGDRLKTSCFRMFQETTYKHLPLDVSGDRLKTSCPRMFQETTYKQPPLNVPCSRFRTITF